MIPLGPVVLVLQVAQELPVLGRIRTRLVLEEVCENGVLRPRLAFRFKEREKDFPVSSHRQSVARDTIVRNTFS